MDARRVIGGIGRVLIATGVLILMFVAYQLWGTGLAEARSQSALRDDFLGTVERPTSTTVPGAEATTTTAPPPPPRGEAVAIMRIPKIGVEKAVIEGVSVPALKKGPGHYPSTPLPGQPGNAAIAGHRTTYGAPFYNIDELVPGDEILVTTRQGEFRYEVRTSTVVKPSQNEVLDATEDNRLTLTTCHPRFSARERLIVVAALADPPAPAPPPSTTPGAVLAGEELEDLSGEAAARGPALAWGALAAAIWFGSWLLSKRWGRASAYSLGLPLFLVVLFVFFENFARLLPADV